MVVHDGVVHSRFPTFGLERVGWIQEVAEAHRAHHKGKMGVPYGLFLGPHELHAAERGVPPDPMPAAPWAALLGSTIGSSAVRRREFSCPCNFVNFVDHRRGRWRAGAAPHESNLLPVRTEEAGAAMEASPRLSTTKDGVARTRKATHQISLVT